jgi:hypothetical protein
LAAGLFAAGFFATARAGVAAGFSAVAGFLAAARARGPAGFSEDEEAAALAVALAGFFAAGLRVRAGFLGVSSSAIAAYLTFPEPA